MIKIKKESKIEISEAYENENFLILSYKIKSEYDIIHYITVNIDEINFILNKINEYNYSRKGVEQ